MAGNGIIVLQSAYNSGTDITDVYLYSAESHRTAQRSPWNNHNRLLSLQFFSILFIFVVVVLHSSLHFHIMCWLLVVIVCCSLLRFCHAHQYNNCIHKQTVCWIDGWMDGCARYLQTTINQNDELTDQLSIQTAKAVELPAKAPPPAVAAASTDK